MKRTVKRCALDRMVHPQLGGDLLQVFLLSVEVDEPFFEARSVCRGARFAGDRLDRGAEDLRRLRELPCGEPGTPVLKVGADALCHLLSIFRPRLPDPLRPRDVFLAGGPFPPSQRWRRG